MTTHRYNINGSVYELPLCRYCGGIAVKVTAASFADDEPLFFGAPASHLNYCIGAGQCSERIDAPWRTVADRRNEQP